MSPNYNIGRNEARTDLGEARNPERAAGIPFLPDTTSLLLRGNMHRRSVLSTIAVVALTGCVSLPPPLLSSCSQGGAPPIAISIDGRTASTTFDVLTYNIEGLAWPARGKRGTSLRKIAARLADLRRTGKAPDIVMVQEMFSRTAVRSMTNIGYANVVTGPTRTQSKRLLAAQPMPGPYNRRRGEVGFHAVNSGLAIFSRFPISYTLSEPFGVHRCAGLDCLSNKGMLFARLAIPNVPVAIDLVNTHLNSQGASRVAPVRAAAQRHRPRRQGQRKRRAQRQNLTPINKLRSSGDRRP
jgi:hypothetical protein